MFGLVAISSGVDSCSSKSLDCPQESDISKAIIGVRSIEKVMPKEWDERQVELRIKELEVQKIRLELEIMKLRKEDNTPSNNELIDSIKEELSRVEKELGRWIRDGKEYLNRAGKELERLKHKLDELFT